MDLELRWRANIHRAIAWLRAPSEAEDYASFQLGVLWADGVERLPETYALEISSPRFNLDWERLQTSTASRSVLVSPARSSRRDGKVTVRSVVVRGAPPPMRRDEYDPADRYNHAPLPEERRHFFMR